MSNDLFPSQISTAPYNGLSTYAPGLVAFDGNPSAPNSVLWIGGLYAGLDTTGGANLQAMEQHIGEGWSVVQSIRSSSYSGWGCGSIRQDAEEVAKLVEYYATVGQKKKLVLVGHSSESRLPPARCCWSAGLSHR